MEKSLINKEIRNNISNVNSLKGFEIISETFADKVFDLFGKNSLLSIHFQVGAGPGETIAERIKEKYHKEDFEIL